MTTGQEQSVAIVLVAHGDRGGDGGNKHLSDHAAALTESGHFAGVFWGVLNGTPTVEDALKEADGCGADQIIVYPLFMSAGYFVKTVLADRVSAAGLETPTGIMQPLGLDKRLALLMLEHALRASRAAKIDPAEARLLIVGHGSKKGPESADATKRAARLLSEHSPFARIETAFIDEEPLLGDVLTSFDGTTVVAGFLSGDGLHAGEDVPEAIKETGARALYTGPIGMHPRVPEFIISAVARAVEEQNGSDMEAAAPLSAAAPPSPAVPPPSAAAPAKAQGDLASSIETPAARRSRRRAGPLRLLFKAATVLVLMAVLAIGAVTFLVPEDAIREQVAAAVKQKTGRTLTIGGSTSFALVPNVGVELEDVAISNPPGMAQGETLRIKVLNVNLKLLPLLTKQVEIERFVLEHPVFNLVVDRQGRKNWDFSKTAALERDARRPVFAQSEKARARMIFAQAGGSAGGGVTDVRLGTVRVTNGTVNYTDEGTGERQTIKALNVTVEQPGLSDPLEAAGDLVWQGEKVTFDARLDDVPALLRDQPSGAALDFSTRHWKGDFKGKLVTTPALSANGTVNGATASVRGLVDWLGNPLPPGGGLGAMTVKGNLALAGETITLSKMRLTIDGMNGNGEMKVRTSGVRPHITAALNLEKLDLNPYIEDDATATRALTPARDAAKPQPAPQSSPQPEQGESLTDFIKKLDKNKPAPQVRAWSQQALNYAGLRAMDADLKLSTKAIHLRNIKTGASEIDANIRSGVLNAKLNRMALYSGSGAGQVQLNGARAVPAMSASFNLSGISALPMLRDASDFKWISGRANIALNVTGTGRSQSEMMRSLQGRGNFSFTNGAIEGVNIPAMVRGLKQGRFDGWKRSDREKTDFSQLSASFTIQRGVAFNQDLYLVGPLLRMTGEGNVDIGNERIDYTALPRIVSSLQGQGAQVDATRGIAVPVSIKGSWENPKIKPDLERLLNDPELARDAINKIGKALKKDGELNKVLQGILGGGQQQGQAGAPGSPQAQPGQPGEQIKPGDVLKNLLGGR